MEANITSLDAIVRSIREMFKKEDHIANVLESAIKSPAFNCDENEIPLSLDDLYALIKTNFHFLTRNPSSELANLVLNEIHMLTQDCFHTSNVESFVFRTDSDVHFNGTNLKLNPEAKQRLKVVKSACKQYLAIQVIESSQETNRDSGKCTKCTKRTGTAFRFS